MESKALPRSIKRLYLDPIKYIQDKDCYIIPSPDLPAFIKTAGPFTICCNKMRHFGPNNWALKEFGYVKNILESRASMYCIHVVSG